MNERERVGAMHGPEGTTFRLWAPAAGSAEVIVDGRTHPMERTPAGVFEARIAGVGAGARYRFRAGGDAWPDPASRFQPDGVHGDSVVVAPLPKPAPWRGVAREDLVFYEMHVGTFTPDGTFDSARARVPELASLGVTALEILPVGDFPGRWNWGYDPAAMFAPSRAYGTPESLRRLVDDAHAHGLAVFLDCVYNHFGPAGAYAPAFSAEFFTKEHETPWGVAIDLRSRHVRSFFIQNAVMWLAEYGFDGLRLDATFALFDDSPKHFLAELAESVPAGKILIAEDHRNDRTLIETWNLDGVWVDDFHHQVRVTAAGDRGGYFRDYRPSTADLAKILRDGWLFQGEHSEVFGHARGTSPAGLEPSRFVFFLQNHDQIGNRPMGDRLAVAPEVKRALTAMLLFAPQLPLLFMGQEWDASTPWRYFTDHDEELGKKVSEGRKKEFSFAGEVPDPQDPANMHASKLRWEERVAPRHASMLKLHTDLLARRRTLRGPWSATSPQEGTLVLRRGESTMVIALGPASVEARGDVEWTTESYASDPRPPRAKDGRIHFERAGAVLLR